MNDNTSRQINLLTNVVNLRNKVESSDSGPFPKISLEIY